MGEEGIVRLGKTVTFQPLFPWVRVQGNGTECWHSFPARGGGGEFILYLIPCGSERHSCHWCPEALGGDREKDECEEQLGSKVLC